MKRKNLLVMGLMTAASLLATPSWAQITVVEGGVDYVEEVSEETQECAEVTIRDANTGGTSYYDSCSSVVATEDQGVAYYSDGQAHSVVKVLSTNVKKGTNTGNYRLVLTREIPDFSPGGIVGTGLLPRPPNPPSPVCPIPDVAIPSIGGQ